ncbi:MAG: tellurite resistance TerB family protein [Pseudomonadota bacterium]
MTTEMRILFPAGDPEPNELPDLDEAERMFDDSDSDWSMPEAFLCLVLEAAFADGEMAAEERQEIAALVRRCRTMKRLTPERLAQVNQTVIDRVKADREGSIKEACRVLPRDMRMSVYTHCMDIVLADRKFRDSEEAFLKKISDYMGLEDETVSIIRKVMFIKNSY